MDITFHELTGINVILQYSTTILKNILGNDEAARKGTYVVSATNLTGSFLGLWTVTTFGKRSLLLFGHSTIALLHIAIGIFTMTGFNYGVLVAMSSFLIVYQCTSGPVSWGYAVETCPDISLGVVIQTLYGVVFILSLTTDPLMDSALQP